MLKKFLLGLCGLFAIVVILIALFGSRFFDSAVREGLTTYGPNLTGTPIELGEVQISPWNGEGTIRELVIGNPEGFDGDYALRLPLASLALDLSSLLDETVVVHRVYIEQPSVNLEAANETLNLRRIQQNIAEAVGADEEEPDSAPDKKFIVEEFVLASGRVTMEEIDGDVSLPELRITNIGQGEGGVPAKRVAQIIMEEVLREAAGALGDEAADLIDNPEEALGTAGSITDTISDWFGGDDNNDSK